MSPSCKVCVDLDRAYANRPGRLQPFGDDIWYQGSGKALVKSAVAGCVTCLLLLRAIREFDRDWETTEGDSQEIFFQFCGKSGIEDLFVRYGFEDTGAEVDGSSHLITRTWLEFYQVSGTPSPWRDLGLTRTLPHDCSLESCLQNAPRWIKQCAESHDPSQCPPNIDLRLPARVLDVGFSPSREGIFLRETKGLEGQYICLSHCWGDLQPLTTTRSTLSSRLQGISWDDLPLTFQDTITLSRGLGVRYVWIDSLCIVQDDPIDWARESSAMASIYGNSYLTITAAWARNSTMGLFSYRDATIRNMVKVLKLTSNGQEVQVFVRRRPGHDILISRQNPYRIGADRRNIHPLYFRAWALQEHVLAPRSLIFGPYEVSWECRTEILCCCPGAQPGINPIPSLNVDGKFNQGYKRQLASALAFSIEDDSKVSGTEYIPDTSWQIIVEGYTSRALSFEKDKLPALSGIAKEWQKIMTGPYLAGLWLNDNLASNLLWKAREPHSSCRPTQYRAPSWSWASMDGPVQFHRTRRDLDSSDVEIMEAFCSPKTSDPTGEIGGGYIRLHGRVVKVTYRLRTPELDSELPYKLGDYWCQRNSAFAKLRLDVVPAGGGEDQVNEGETIYCLVCLMSVGRYHKALALRAIKSRPNEYQRVGVMDISDQTEAVWFEGMERTVITIF